MLDGWVPPEEGHTERRPGCRKRNFVVPSVWSFDCHRTIVWGCVRACVCGGGGKETTSFRLQNVSFFILNPEARFGRCRSTAGHGAPLFLRPCSLFRCALSNEFRTCVSSFRDIPEWCLGLKRFQGGAPHPLLRDPTESPQGEVQFHGFLCALWYTKSCVSVSPYAPLPHLQSVSAHPYYTGVCVLAHRGTYFVS